MATKRTAKASAADAVSSGEVLAPAESGQTVSGRELLDRLCRINLNLLPICQALLHLRSVTKAADGLGLTQSAISHALKQLRIIFDDELLVASGRTAQLTPRAQAILVQVNRILTDTGRLLKSNEPFDPATEALQISIVTTDYVAMLIAPEIVRICANEAPRTAVRFVDQKIYSIDDLGRVDLAMAPRPFAQWLGKRVQSIPLWRDEIVCIASKRNRSLPGRIDGTQFRKLKSVSFELDLKTPRSTRSLLQPTSRIETAPICSAPNFTVLAEVVQKTDCVALVPRKLAELAARPGKIRIVEVDMPKRELMIDAIWAPSVAEKRGHGWFCAVVERAAAELR